MIGFGVAFAISTAIALSTAVLFMRTSAKYVEHKMALIDTAAVAATCAAFLVVGQIVASL